MQCIKERRGYKGGPLCGRLPCCAKGGQGGRGAAQLPGMGKEVDAGGEGGGVARRGGALGEL